MNKHKLLLSITFALICFIGFAQNSVNQLDANGKRHGVWTKNFHKTKQKRYEGNFKHGKEVDSFKFFTLSSGKSVLSAIKVFNENDSIADVTFIASTKKVISKGRMDGKRFIGEWTFYHKNADAKMMVENYNDDGELEGERFVYYKNGVIAESANYLAGKLHGDAKWFSEQNVLLKHSVYENDKLEGKTINYEISGKVDSEGDYIANQKKGIWKYYKDGKLTKEVDHTNQKVISKKE